MKRRFKLIERVKNKCVNLNLRILNENEINTTNSRFNVQCLKCNNIFSVACKDILNRNRTCSLCKTKNKRYTLSFILEQIEQFCQKNDYKLLTNIEKPIIQQKISLQHKNGGVKELFISQIIYNPNQIISLPYTFVNKQDIIEKEINEKCEQYNLTPLSIEKFINEKMKIVLQCNECKRIWTTSYRVFSKCKYPCRCRKHSYTETKEERINKILKICKLNDYTFLGWVDEEKYGVHYRIKIQCNKHKHIWYPIYKDFIAGKGCMLCSNECNVYEQRFLRLLQEKFPKIEIIYQYRNKEIFKKQSLDFYLPQFNIAIECQGEQHFKEVKYFDSKNNDLKKIQERDLKKFQICQNNNIKLFYLSFSARKYLPKQYFAKIYCDVDELLKEIEKFIEKNNQIVA